MYQRILVPLDGSKLAQQILPYVHILATYLDAPIELLRVITSLPPELSASLPNGADLDHIVSKMSRHARDDLAKVETSFADAGLKVTSRVEHGSVASQIVDEAKKQPNALIAMTTQGMSGTSYWALGSTTGKVLEATGNPLLITSSREETVGTTEVKLNTIIVPLDGSSVSEEVLPCVVSLARPTGMKVILVRVISSGWQYFEHMDHTALHYGDPSKDENDRAAKYLQTVSQKLIQKGIASVEERVLQGHVAESIVEVAQQTGDNLVAMTSHGSSNASRWSLGSVAYRVVQQSGDPVLVVRAGTGRAANTW